MGAMPPVTAVTRSRYEPTHGQYHVGAVAPWVQAYAKDNTVALEKVLRALFAKGRDPKTARGQGPVLISSIRHITGRWTYVQTDSVQLYELVKTKARSDHADVFVALCNDVTPARILKDPSAAPWRLAVLNGRYELLQQQTLITPVAQVEVGLWDMIYTDVEAAGDRLRVSIGYAHAGGGDTAEQAFVWCCDVAAPATPGP